MDFINRMANELLENYNVSVTENGAVGYRTTGKALLDINFAVASLRSASENEIVEKFKRAFFEDKLLAVKWLFYARDVRGGLGERRLFRVVMKYIADYEPDLAAAVVPLIAEYGRFDDMWCLLDNEKLRPVVITTLAALLNYDLECRKEGKPISLLAKWLPSANASSADTKRYAKIIQQSLCISERNYRMILSDLRKYLDVTERKMSAKQWREIDYEKVPSRANLIYNGAFLRNDEERRRAYLTALEKGEAKINASALYPHDITHKYIKSYYTWGTNCKLNDYDPGLEAMWKALPNTVSKNGNTIVVADSSGSMHSTVGKTNIAALDVANALAIYFAERSSGQFKDKYITFSTRPQLVDLGKAQSLRDKIAIALNYSECSDTNIEAVFDLILSTAKNSGMRQEDMPANVLVISDMEFNSAVCAYDNLRLNANLFKIIEQKYASAGYKLPRLVFWNVNSRTGTIPVRENDMGVALVSGFSVNICKMVMSGKTDPYECLIETLNSERYKPVEYAVKDCLKS